MITIEAIADLHCQTPTLTGADILVIAGDLTYRGSIKEIESVAVWIAAQPHKHKVVIAGNHDFGFENGLRATADQIMVNYGIHYLFDSAITLEEISIYGTPWSPRFHDWAFNVDRDKLHYKWSSIPYGLDLLLVHGPPFGFGDRTVHGERVGCAALLKALEEKRPSHVCYGHIHEDRGQWSMNSGATQLYNCSIGPIYTGDRMISNATSTIIKITK